MFDAPVASAVAGGALCLFALITAISALSARSLFIGAMALAATSAFAAAALLAVGQVDAALAMAAFGVAVAPVVMLGATLLSAAAAKPARRAWPLLAISLAAGASAAVLAAAPELAETQRITASAPAPGLWLAGLMVVAALAAAGLLGYGERGVFERDPRA